MLLANLAQAQVAMPTWVGTVTAISLVIIALSFVAVAVGLLSALKASSKQLDLISHVLTGLDDDLIPAFRNLREITDKGKGMVDGFKNEAEAIVRTSRRMRRRAREGADRIEERFQDLDALYEVVHEELAEAALDVATMVRTVRTGSGIFNRIRRFLPGARRR